MRRNISKSIFEKVGKGQELAPLSNEPTPTIQTDPPMTVEASPGRQKRIDTITQERTKTIER